MYIKTWCTCKVVVLLIKPTFFFLTFSLPSASLDLKVPNYNQYTFTSKTINSVFHFTQVRVQNIKRQLDATFLCSCWIESFHTKTLFPDDSVFNVYSKKSRGAI